MGILKTAVYGLSQCPCGDSLPRASLQLQLRHGGTGNLDVNCIAQDHAATFGWERKRTLPLRRTKFQCVWARRRSEQPCDPEPFAAPTARCCGTTRHILLRHDGAFSQIHPLTRDGIFTKNRKRVHSDCTGPGGHRGRSGAFLLRRTPRTPDRRADVSGRQTIWSMLATPNGVLCRMRLRGLPS